MAFESISTMKKSLNKINKKFNPNTNIHQRFITNPAITKNYLK